MMPRPLCVLAVVTRARAVQQHIRMFTCERDDFAIQFISANPPMYPRKIEYYNKDLQCGTALVS